MKSVSQAAPTVHRRKAAPPPHGVTRLTLSINGTDYTVRPLWCDGVHASRLFRLRKVGTPKRYCVAQTPDGAVCDCPDWVFNRDGIDPDGCKHIKAMVAVGLLPPGKGGVA
jgi:hypothetical protein